MPIFEYQCPDCGETFEAIQLGGGQTPPCSYCGQKNGQKLISATASSVGQPGQSHPGPGDHGCCGSNPSDKGCVPGSCCGRS